MSYKKLYSTPEYTPIEISTDAEMASVLVDANIGKTYKFTGATGTYTNGDLYTIEEVV